MNVTRYLGVVRAVPASAVLAFLALAGCGGGGTAPVPASQAPSLPSQSLPIRESGSAPSKIYVTNALNNKLTTYNYDGTPTTPTITDSISDPQGLAVDHNGKIYVANGKFGGSVTTYDRFGNKTSPTISTESPFGVAVDANGKIYVVSGIGLNTYNPDGSASTPTIRSRADAYFYGIAVDAKGKIYIPGLTYKCLGFSCYGHRIHYYLWTYSADGKRTHPTIHLNFRPDAVAVDTNGKIYVVGFKDSRIKSYNPDGSPTTPTITGLHSPDGVAVDASGKIYVTNGGHNTITTYNPDGSRTTPTISGLQSPTGVAVH